MKRTCLVATALAVALGGWLGFRSTSGHRPVRSAESGFSGRGADAPPGPWVAAGEVPDGTSRREGPAFVSPSGEAEGATAFVEIPHRHDGAGEGHRLEIPAGFRGLSTDEWIDRLPEAWSERATAYRRELSTFDPEFRRYLCWGPGTPPEVIGLFRRLEIEGGMAPGPVRTMATQFLGSGHWSRTATDGSGQSVQGRPVTVTWSIAQENTFVPGLSGTSAASDLRARLAGLYGGNTGGSAESQPWFPLFEECFEELASQSGIRFVYEPNDDGRSFSNTAPGALGARGDIRIGGRALDGNSGTLAFAYGPDYGDVVIDTDDSYFSVLSSNSARLVNVLTHELGHAIGLDHVCPINQTKLMEPFVTTSFRGTRFDEWQSLQRQYGDRLEVEGGVRDNDSAANARVLELPVGGSRVEEWLSIDDNGDSDWFAVDTDEPRGLGVTVVPSPAVYLEGPQNNDDTCSSGTTFDSSTQQDLAVEVRGPDGTTVLAAANSVGLGGTEALSAVPLPEAGRYYVRVSGGTANTAQLYRLELESGAVPSAVELQVVGIELVDESNVGSNGIPDPGETVRMNFTIENQGNVDATAVVVTLEGPSGWSGFVSQASPGVIAAGASASVEFTFAQEGDCGETVELMIELASAETTRVEPIPLTLGSTGGDASEGFEDPGGLPEGWSTEASGGTPWTRVTARADAGVASAFAPGVSAVSASSLVSVPMTIGTSGRVLSFRHWYDTESRYDGGVLEASLDGGGWFDLPTSTGVVVGQGGYNQSLYSSSNPLASRQSWTGNSGAFVTTSLTLPAVWSGREIRLRWRLGHDGSVSNAGWWLDSVELTGDPGSCDPFRPVLTLTASGSLSERDPATAASLTLATPLSLAREVIVTPVISGEADAADLESVPLLVLGAGSASVSADLVVVRDELSEGTEALEISLPPSSPAFAAGSPSQVVIPIEDLAYGEWAAASVSAPLLEGAGEQDADGDGHSNLEEYLLGTDPQDPGSRPVRELVWHPDSLEIRLPSAISREDAVIRGETSSDLTMWTGEGVTPTAVGFAVAREQGRRFLRLVFEMVDP